MKYQFGLLLFLLLLLFTGCVHILVPVPVFIPAKRTGEAAGQAPTQPAPPAVTQTNTLTTPTATALTATPTNRVAVPLTPTLATTVTAGLTATQAISPVQITSEHLATALALTPPGIRAAYFTDWAVIKQNKNATALTSKSPMDEQMAFLLALTKDQASPNVYGSRAFLRFASTWSWNTLDLAWEVTLDSERAPVHILKFRDDFDLTPVLAHFAERDFQQQMVDGATVYTHEQALTADWFKIGEFSIINTAVISEAKLFVLSSDIEGVKLVLDAYHEKAPALSSDTAVRTTVAGLGDIAAAIITPGPDTCLGLSFDAISQQLLQTQQITETLLPKLKAELLSDAEFHVYDNFAIGYRYQGSQPLGILVMHYPTGADAQADLAPRRAAAEKRASLVSSTPYSDTLFTVDTANVNGNNLIFQLRPHADQPARIFQMFFYRDMAFAGCP